MQAGASEADSSSLTKRSQKKTLGRKPLSSPIRGRKERRRTELPIIYADFRLDDKLATRRSLELHLRSESDNDGVPRPSAHIGVILHDWLKQDHRSDIQENIELKAVFGIPGSGIVRPEIRA
jgi:hypothetical protein